MPADNYLKPYGDSGPMPLDGQPKKLVRFDPTINSGTILQIMVVVVGGIFAFSAVKTELAEQKVDLNAVKATALTERAQTKEALTELKADVKDLTKATGDIKESLAILRGRGGNEGARK